MASFEANVADRFPGAKKLEVRAGNDTVKTVNVQNDGSVKVEAPVGSYVLTDGERSISITVKEDQDARTRVGREAQAAELRFAQAEQRRKNPALESPAPGYTTDDNTVTGARSSLDSKRTVVDKFPQPHPNQLDVEKVPQRSDTPFGEAHPIPKEELELNKDPEKVRDSLDGEQMRSDTEFGAQPVVPKEEIKREEILAKDDGDLEGVDPKPKNAALASDTEQGTKPLAHVSNEVPPEDSPPIKDPKPVPAEGVRQPASKPKKR